jgi:NTP pyrophosphatase (non-canonical NTP hydrolase)
MYKQYDILKFAEDRGLLEIPDISKQLLKLYEEAGEFTDHFLRGKDVKDDLGDIYVTWLILCSQLGYSPEACIDLAVNEIKDRKGVTKGGVFIKEEDQLELDL